MSELAFNINGDSFEVPAQATGWRVRRMKAKGAPEVVYGRSGQPLVLPLEADVDDLRHEATAAGRYRLDPVDDANKPIADATPGYVFVHEERPLTAAIERVSAPAVSDSIVIEAMRMNTELSRTIVDRFPQMMEAAATLLRAADGAGLPARQPLVAVHDEDSDDDDDDQGTELQPAGFDLNAVVAQLVPVLVSAMMSGKLKVPGLGAMLDWRKAVPGAPATDTETERTTPRASSAKLAHTPADSSNAADTTLPIDPASMAHFIAVQSELTPEEAALAREIAGELGPGELRAWFDHLSTLSVAEAVATIRSFTGTKIARTGGAS